MSVVVDKENSYEYIHILLDIGESMLCSGAEINRIEEALLKLSASYKLKEINVFVIPSLITLTIRTDDGFELTQSRRILSRSITTNLYRLEKLNNIVHQCRQKTVSLRELKEYVNVSNKPVALLQFVFGSILAAFSFALFFGASISEAWISGLVAVIICFFQWKISSVLPNRIIVTFLCSFAVGVTVLWFAKAFPSLNSGRIMIGDIMLLIPGVAVTISVRDIILGDTISGAIRLIESLFIAGGLAVGFWFALFLFGE